MDREKLIARRNEICEQLIAGGMDYDDARFESMTKAKAESGLLSEQPASEETSTINAFYADQDHTEAEGWAYITDASGLQKFTITDAAKYEAHCAKMDAIEAKRIAKQNNFLLNYDLDCG